MSEKYNDWNKKNETEDQNVLFLAKVKNRNHSIPTWKMVVYYSLWANDFYFFVWGWK